MAVLLIFVSVAGFQGCSAPATAWADRSETIGELRAYRAGLSLYEGAPPVIPHEVASLGRKDCANCHTPGTPDNGARVASPYPHPEWRLCEQCHVEITGTSIFVENDLTPLRWRVWDGDRTGMMPKCIPHHLQNRENCAVCHIGDQSHPALRANHGYRPACLQCHIQQVQL